MSRKREAEMVSLTEICEEKRLFRDKETGKYLEKGVYFSSMGALIQGALSLVGFFENIHKNGYVYGGNAAEHFRFSLKTGELSHEAERYLIKAYSALPHDVLTDSVASESLQQNTVHQINTAEQDFEMGHTKGTGQNSGADRISGTDLIYETDLISGLTEASEASDAITGAEKNVPELQWPGRLVLNEFMAPELVEAAAAGQDFQFTMETDWYFMSVMLFEYFFHTGSPFEGKMMVNRCFLSPLEKELYRVENGQFCMDIGEVKNTPVKGIQDKLIKYWGEYPRMLRKMFQRAFIDGGTLSNLRPTEVDWKQLLVRLAMDYQICRCGFKGFSFRLTEKENGTLLCPKCKKIYYPLSNGMDRILLAEGKRLYACQTGRDPFDKDTVTGLVVENRQKKGLYGIKNVSKGVWRGMYPDNTIKEIGSGQGIPIWNGMKLRFELGEDWSLRLIQPMELYEESEVEENEQ